MRIIPSPFNEREADEYILHFEKVSLSLGWTKESLTMLLQCVSGGKTQDIYSALAIDLCSQDDEGKWEILKTYELVPENYRQKSRKCRKKHIETHLEFAPEKETLCDRW